MNAEEAMARLRQIRDERCETAKRVFSRLRAELQEIQYEIPKDVYRLELALPPFSALVYRDPLEEISRTYVNVDVELEDALSRVDRACRQE